MNINGLITRPGTKNSCSLEQIKRHGIGRLGSQSQQIHPSIQIKSIVLKMYSHPHSTPQRIPMGNHRMGHHQT
jgi:hypothetical protein